MALRDPTAWMWAEAFELIDRAERMRRQFFRFGAGAARSAWEPPADVVEDERELTVIVALPGVSPDRVEVGHDGRDLIVRAERRVSFADRPCAVRQLEIPYGCFERRITLPGIPLEPRTQRWADGCLILTLRKL